MLRAISATTKGLNMRGQIIGILCSVLGDIDYTRFYPPLDNGGIARCRNAEDAIRLARRALEEIKDVSKARGYNDILSILNTPREVEDRDTSSPTLAEATRRPGGRYR